MPTGSADTLGTGTGIPEGDEMLDRGGITPRVPGVAGSAVVPGSETGRFDVDGTPGRGGTTPPTPGILVADAEGLASCLVEGRFPETNLRSVIYRSKNLCV